MSAWLTKSTTLSLAVFYALLVSFGHALHSHGDCCDEKVASCEVACSCGHHHEPAQASDSDDSDWPGWGKASSDNCCEDCAACQLLSHLKVGHHVVDQFTAVGAICGEGATVYHAPFRSSIYEAWAPRGPPRGISS